MEVEINDGSDGSHDSESRDYPIQIFKSHESDVCHENDLKTSSVKLHLTGICEISNKITPFPSIEQNPIFNSCEKWIVNRTKELLNTFENANVNACEINSKFDCAAFVSYLYANNVNLDKELKKVQDLSQIKTGTIICILNHENKRKHYGVLAKLPNLFISKYGCDNSPICLSTFEQMSECYNGNGIIYIVDIVDVDTVADVADDIVNIS